MEYGTGTTRSRLRRQLANVLAALLGLLLVSWSVHNGPQPTTEQPVVAIPMTIWQTSPVEQRMTQLPTVSFGPTAGTTLPVISVTPSQRYQRIAGFGGAFNELGWKALLALPESRRQAVLRALFDPQVGAGYSLARTPIGSSDYALDAYSLDDVRGDTTLRDFSISRDQQLLLPYIKAARAIAPALTLWASPWSAPAWMKSNQSMVHGGSLLKAYEPVYAQYFARYVQAYATEGIPIAAVSVQNEPTQGPKYPSMVMPATQMARFVGQDLGPLFAHLGLTTQIRINEEPSRSQWRYSLTILADAAARSYVAGSNIHGYHGSSTDLSLLHSAAPDLDIWQTEDLNLDHSHFEYSDAEHWATEIVQDLQNWAGGWDFWNMVTDQTGRSSWGWQQDSVVVVNTRTQTVRYTPKYYAMAHFSRFIRPGAYRIGISGVPKGLTATAAQDPDGRVVLVAVNSLAQPVRFVIDSAGEQVAASIPAHGIRTFVWQPGA